MHAGLQNIVLWTASTCAPPPSVVHPADGSSKGPSSRRSLLLILLVSYMMFLAPAGAADRRVPPDYPTIQGAFNAAQFGDRVLIAMGTYHEPLTLNRRGIELAGAGIGQTMLDGSSNGSGALLLISSVDSTVIARNITFTGQHAAGSAGGIRVVNASPIIVDCEIADNRGATGGGGIYVYGFDRANPIICRNIIRNNETISWGGGAAALTTSAAATES